MDQVNMGNNNMAQVKIMTWNILYPYKTTSLSAHLISYVAYCSSSPQLTVQNINILPSNTIFVNVSVSHNCAAALTSYAHPEAVQSNSKAFPAWGPCLSGSVKGFPSPKPFKQF